MTAAKPTLDDLRKPFPPAVIGKLPKGNATLDFVGHAAVTDRLLSVDPQWSWEPFATDENGLPAYDRAGNLWIRLTVLGVTRIGVGDGPDPKQRIGDALRNAAMRFGVALDLWTKGELESTDPNGGDAQARPARQDRPAAEQDPWRNPTLVRKPAAVTDPKWADDFRGRVAGCDKLPVLRGLFDELTAQVKANAVSPDDAVELRALVEEQAADLTKQAERPEAGAA